MIPFLLLSAFLWGICVACFMQYTRLGLFLSVHLTWFATALGCGVNWLLLLLVTNNGLTPWWMGIAVFALSSIGPSVRGIVLHRDIFSEVMDGTRTTGE